MLKVRVTGTPEEVREGIGKLKQYFIVQDVSKLYRNSRSPYVRAYASLMVDKGGGTVENNFRTSCPEVEGGSQNDSGRWE